MDVIVARNLSVSLEGRTILRDIDFEVSAGQWIGILGPNGAGKTTLLRALAGLVPYTGSMLLDNTEVCDWQTRNRAMRLAFVRQNHPLAFDFRVDEMVLLGRSPHKNVWSVYEKSDYDLLRQSLTLLDLDGFESRGVTSLSGGEQQRVFLAQALVQEAGILLLDEPTAHLDIHHQFEFLTVVRETVERGMTVLGAFHDIELAARFSDSLLVLDQGTIVAAGSPENVLTHDLIARVFRMNAELESDAKGRQRIFFDSTIDVNNAVDQRVINGSEP